MTQQIEIGHGGPLMRNLTNGATSVLIRKRAELAVVSQFEIWAATYESWRAQDRSRPAPRWRSMRAECHGIPQTYFSSLFCSFLAR